MCANKAKLGEPERGQFLFVVSFQLLGALEHRVGSDTRISNLTAIPPVNAIVGLSVDDYGEGMIGVQPFTWRDRAAAALATRDGRIAAGLAAFGLLLWAFCSFRPSLVPFWLPWDFSPLWYAGFAFTSFCYARGCRIAAPARWRIAVFAIGMALVWAVVQTRYEYLALHQFFYNRLQHMVMHHLGPFLIAVAWPWPTILAGMPASPRRVVDHPWCRKVIAASRQPEIAGFLFVGLLALWLVPEIHLAAMLSPILYPIMNWSMVIDGLLFWSLVLDPRSPAEAGISFAGRAVTAVGVLFPQIALGAYLCFADHDLYPFYTWCGRLYETIDPLMDQRIGGAIVWESPGMMTVFALFFGLTAKRRFEEATAPPKREGSVSSGGWTGR